MTDTMIAIAVIFFLTGGAWSGDIDVDAGAWFPRLGGTVRFDEKPLAGARLDWNDDLGSGDTMAISRLSVATHGWGLQFEVGFERADAEFDAMPSSPFQWNDTLWPAGETVETTFERLNVWGGVRYPMVDRPEDVRIDAGLRGRYLKHELTLSSGTMGSDGDNLGAFAPEIVVGNVWTLHPVVAVVAEASAAYAGLGDLDGYGVAAEAGIGWCPWSMFVVSLGYRVERWEIANEDSRQRNEIREGLEGFFASFSWHF